MLDITLESIGIIVFMTRQIFMSLHNLR
jgi:hypothetical protein